MQDKLIRNIKNKFIVACEKNLELTKKINKKSKELIKAKEENNDLFIEVNQIEIESYILEYNRNASIVGESIIQLDIIQPNFVYN